MWDGMYLVVVDVGEGGNTHFRGQIPVEQEPPCLYLSTTSCAESSTRKLNLIFIHGYLRFPYNFEEKKVCLFFLNFCGFPSQNIVSRLP